MNEPRWRNGKPNAPGLWLIESTTLDLDAATVEWDMPDEGRQRRYLRISFNCESEPLAGYRWAKRSFGPIPIPKLASAAAVGHLGPESTTAPA